MSFSKLGLSSRLCTTLESLGLKDPTPIQVKAIPEVLAGHDVLGIAQTGTGKTAAFCLPLLESLLRGDVRAGSRHPVVLILSPTRELSRQIHDEISKFCRRTRLRFACVTGGVSQKPQEKVLLEGVEILVATPGRLLDLAANDHVDLGAVSHFVLDEADQLLDMGFIRDVKRIVSRLPRRRQSLLFSATMPREVEKLADEILRSPARLEVSPKVVTVEKVDQGFVPVTSENKPAVLQQLLARKDVRKAIVFTRTKHGANRVAKRLARDGVGVEVIHGNKSQNARNRALESFRNGDAWVLVATDVAARGIDIAEISHVINYELPHEPEVYVHRIGRTARAGASGVAWSLVDPSEQSRLRAIERLTRIKPRLLDFPLQGISAERESSAGKTVELSAGDKRRRSRRRRRPATRAA